MRRVTLILLLATAGLPALAGPAQANPLETMPARAAETQPVQFAQRDYRRDRYEGRDDDRRERRENWRERREDWREDRREWREERREWRADRREWARERRDHRNWNRNWHNDRRYDWRGYRNNYRHIYRPGWRYHAPYRGHRYSRHNIGIHIGTGFYGSRYWLNDPWRYRLPAAYGPYRWIRYFDDVLLIDTRDGYVVDVIHDFFW